MRKLNLKNYTVKAKIPDQANPGKMFDAEFPYEGKTSILNLLFIPELQLSGAELVRQIMLAVKLENCTQNEIDLEDEEYQRIKRAFDAFKGFGRADVELVTRINGAAEVEPKNK